MDTPARTLSYFNIYKRCISDLYRQFYYSMTLLFTAREKEFIPILGIQLNVAFREAI